MEDPVDDILWLNQAKVPKIRLFQDELNREARQKALTLFGGFFLMAFGFIIFVSSIS